MSYQVLARKWRPRSFQEMVGQEHVLRALVNALDQSRLHHAYLFTGTRGVGKTTVARIFAKCLNCESGVTSSPCGTCAACREIVEGRFVDLIEIDAASRTKVEDMRELLENVQYAPTRGRFKVYLIDEVHMLSNSSFNALLKTLEEPPPHVKFLLATTDPQKLPVTVLSRCLQFNLKNMSPERIVGHLRRILQEEGIAFEEPALWLLARAADGSMRDALSLTDQAIAFGGRQLRTEEVGAMLGTVDQGQVLHLLHALAERDPVKLLKLVHGFAEFSPDYGQALEGLASALHRIALEQLVPGAQDNSQGDQEEISRLAAMLTAEDVQLFYQIAIQGRQDLPLSPDPRTGFEMTLLRMLAFVPDARAPVAPVSLKQNAETVSEDEEPEPASVSGSSVRPENASPVTGNGTPEVTVGDDQTGSQVTDPMPVTNAEALTDRAAAAEVTADQMPTESSGGFAGESKEADDSGVKAAEEEPEVVAHEPAAQAAIEESQPQAPVADRVDEPHPAMGREQAADSAPRPLQPQAMSPELPGDQVPDEYAADADDAPPVPPLPPIDAYSDEDFDGGRDEDYDIQAYDLDLDSLAPPPSPETAQASVEPVAEPLTEEGAANKRPSEQGPLVDGQSWVELFERLPLSGLTQNLVMQAVLREVRGNQLVFVMDGRHYDLWNRNHGQRLQTALNEVLGREPNVVIEVGEAEWESPAQYRRRRQAERQAEAVEAVRQDPHVAELVRTFEAVVLEDSIQPI